MKVGGPIKLKRVLELIDILMQKVGVLAIANYKNEDYRMPYETTDALVRKGLIIDLHSKTAMEEIEGGAEDLVESEPFSQDNESGEQDGGAKNENVFERKYVVDEQEKEVLDAILGKEEIVIRENEAFYNGEKCVFKPYFEGYKNSDAIIIPITKEKFDRLKESKKAKIFNGALKKFNKRTKKK
jgi:hypothetical protein